MSFKKLKNAAFEPLRQRLVSTLGLPISSTKWLILNNLSEWLPDET